MKQNKIDLVFTVVFAVIAIACLIESKHGMSTANMAMALVFYIKYSLEGRIFAACRALAKATEEHFPMKKDVQTVLDNVAKTVGDIDDRVHELQEKR